MDRDDLEDLGGPLAQVEHEPGDGLVFATVRGEIDLSNAATVEEEILLGAGSVALAVDLSELAYLDSSGLAMLLRISERLGAEQRAFCVVVPPEAPTRRLFTLVGLEDSLAVAPDREVVLARLAGSRE